MRYDPRRCSLEAPPAQPHHKGSGVGKGCLPAPVRHRVTDRCWGSRLFPGLAEHPGGSLPTSPSPRGLQPRPLYPT